MVLLCAYCITPGCQQKRPFVNRIKFTVTIWSPDLRHSGLSWYKICALAIITMTLLVEGKITAPYPSSRRVFFFYFSIALRRQHFILAHPPSVCFKPDPSKSGYALSTPWQSSPVGQVLAGYLLSPREHRSVQHNQD